MAVATTTQSRLAIVTAEVAGLAQREDVGRLLAEEREREEAVRHAAEQRQRAQRAREQIAEAEALVREGKIDEAERLLGQLVTDKPNEPAQASCIENLRRRVWAVKTVTVEKALREARRHHRREPREALALLEPLNLDDMPEELVRQAYGCWLEACRRLALETAVHYTPAFGKGAVLLPTEDGRLEVVSAIGLPRWQPGCRFSAAALKGIRPLK